MLAKRNRWLCSLLLVVALVLGLAASSVHAADMDCNMTGEAAGEMTAPDDCGGGGPDGVPAAPCFAFCGSACAVLPIPAEIKATVSAFRAQTFTLPISGRHIRPDPYPPRPVLS